MPDESTKRTEFDGRPATVVYLKPGFEPGTEDDHAMVKIIFDDGDIEYARRRPESEVASPDQQ